MRGKFKKFVSYLLVTTIIAPLWFVSGALSAKAATSVVGGGGTAIVNNSGEYVDIAPLIVKAVADGDINDTGINIGISVTTGAALQFDTSSDAIIADPSSNLNLGNGVGISKNFTASLTTVNISVSTSSAPAGSYVKISGIRVHKTVSGKIGSEQLNITTTGTPVSGETIAVDTQAPVVMGEKISVAGDSGAQANTFKKGDIVNVSWDNSASGGDNNSDIASVAVDFSEFGGRSVVMATKTVSDSDVWLASYLLPNDVVLVDKKVHIIATDDAGNTSVKIADADLYNVDTQAPTVTITRDPSRDINNSSYDFTADFGDATTKQYAVDLGTFETYSGPVTVLSEGRHTFYAKGVDNNGNETIASAECVVDLSQLPAPANLVSGVGGGGDITLTWSAVSGVDYYNVYYQKYSDVNYTGPVSTTLTTATITGLQSGENYRFIVRAVGKNGTESTDAWLQVLSPASKKVVIATVKPQTTQASETVTTKPVETQPTTIEEPVTDGEIEDGEIKGDETTATEETEEINWTPWIILFILIILAGAATGGYFYWFAGDEEALIEVTEKPEKIKKTIPTEKGKNSSKKPRRW